MGCENIFRVRSSVEELRMKPRVLNTKSQIHCQPMQPKVAKFKLALLIIFVRSVGA